MTTARIQATATHRFQVPAERVYDAWLDPAQVRMWMSAALRSIGLEGDLRNVEIDGRVGGRFCFTDMRSGVETRHRGTYLQLDRPHFISFTWSVGENEEPDPSCVSIAFRSEPGGCQATIVHEMDRQWADYLARTESGWARMLAHIDHLLKGSVLKEGR